MEAYAGEHIEERLVGPGRCPECGGLMAYASGCESCLSCGLSRCGG